MELTRKIFGFATKATMLTWDESPVMFQIRCYAARKGTREKARKKKIKVEIQKAIFVPHNQRAKALFVPTGSKRLIDDNVKSPIDNVWVTKYHKWKVYNFVEAVQNHRESHHPQIFNLPNGFLNTVVELDMTGVKKTKFVEPFTKILQLPYHFAHGKERSVLAFCKSETRGDAEAAGADQIADADFIKKLGRGEAMLPDFDFIVAHPNILVELVGLRGILKKKFPSIKAETLGSNLQNMVTTFKTGLQISAIRDEYEMDYGVVDACLGTLDMPSEHLEANFKAVLEAVNSKRPKRPGPFITRVLLKCDPSRQKFRVNTTPYISENEIEVEDDSDDENQPVAVKQKLI